jgi:alpha-D-ribose 1-methylphosphonate 5-triphosphate synthase subunit PhnH
MPATAAVALTLFDHDTPIWIDERFSAETEIAAWLRFQTGARRTLDTSRAAFALIAGGAVLPDFGSFALGTSEYPDRSTTLVIQVDTLSGGKKLSLTGPGIKGTASMHAGALPSNFAELMQDNSALFPRGIDVLLACGTELIALPRSTRVAAKEV